MNISELETKITEEDIRPIKIVTIAMTAGVLLFVAVSLYLYFSNNSGKVPNYDNSLIDTMLIVLAAIFMSTTITSRIVAKSMLVGAKNFDEKNADKRKYIGLYSSQHIVKLAMVEGSALFGGVVFLLSVMNNQIYAASYNWLSLLPALFLVIHNIYLMPTKEKVIEVLETARRETSI